jgi:hypothetical protein
LQALCNVKDSDEALKKLGNSYKKTELMFFERVLTAICESPDGKQRFDSDKQAGLLRSLSFSFSLFFFSLSLSLSRATRLIALFCAFKC